MNRKLISFYTITTIFILSNIISAQELKLGPEYPPESQPEYQPSGVPSPLPVSPKVGPWYVDNRSFDSKGYQEWDNIRVVFFGPATEMTIIATHPSYLDYIGEDHSTADFTNRPPGEEQIYRGEPQYQDIWTNGKNTLQICNDPNWKEGKSPKMTIVVKGEKNKEYTANQLIFYQKVENNSYIQYCVLYQDGSMRLKPLPPKGKKDTKFGTTVVVGPSSNPDNYSVEIQKVIVDPETSSLDIIYRNGGSATVQLFVDTTRCTANIAINYDTTNGAGEITTMYDTPTECDAAKVDDGNGRIYSIMDFPGTIDPRQLKFFRDEVSTHNPSAPDITIGMY